MILANPTSQGKPLSLYFNLLHIMSHAGCIRVNRHNRVRMDGVLLKRTMEFKQWHLHCLTSCLGFVTTDAFYTMQLEQGPIKLDKFIKSLTESLIFNMFPGGPETAMDL